MPILGHLLIWSSLALIVCRYPIAKRKKNRKVMHYFNEMQNAEGELIATVERVLGREMAAYVANKVIRVNMPKSLVLYVKGAPDDRKESVSYGDTYETWLYGASPYQYGGQIRYKYRFQINIHN